MRELLESLIFLLGSLSVLGLLFIFTSLVSMYIAASYSGFAAAVFASAMVIFSALFVLHVWWL